MCMIISKEDIARINSGFGGNIRNSASLEFALGIIENEKLGEYKKLALLWRAILVDHTFTDGNKRTALFLAFLFAADNKKIAEADLLKHHILSISSKNITEVRNIEWRLKNAIK